ncbi:MAG: hypothetical protein HY660_04400 [Armatimonadetes bacterium]|nr:hypothetical protein [Armatimonadota bacterium]
MTRRATVKRFVDILADLERTVALMRGLLDGRDGTTWDMIAQRLRSHAYYIERRAGGWPSRPRRHLKVHR